MTTKHTSGPLNYYGRFIYPEASGYGPHPIAETYTSPNVDLTEAEAEANARLFAAAPELLEIAKAYKNLLKTMAHTEGQVATFQHIQSVISKVEGAS